MKLLILSLIVSIILIGCGGRSFSYKHPYALDTTPPAGSAVFQQAYTDGCESALSGMGNQFIKVFHNFQYDASKSEDKLYNRMWDASNNYCRLFLFVGDEQLANPDFDSYSKPLWFID